MACRAIHSWTFCGLVGAFLDLALAYCMLCGAAAAFLASKFLNVFNLDLPCPCQGLFGLPDDQCLQGLLANSPIACVQSSVRNRFPFDSVWAQEEGCHCHDDAKYEGEGTESGRLLEMTREEVESNSSVANLNAVNSHNLGYSNLSSMNEGNGHETIDSSCHLRSASDAKNMGVLNSLKPQTTLRRWRRASVDARKLSSILPSVPQLPCQDPHYSLCSKDGQKCEIPGDNIAVLNSRDQNLFMGNMEPSGGIGVYEGGIPDTGSSQQRPRCNAVEKDSVISAPDEDVFGRNEIPAIRILEQALEEEQAARSALYLELEKERSAAATAADEALAMILRLQKEKASIEMEARQYQRIVEGKNVYDEEEMNILKEIIVRRERENNVLEKEVELYRQMLFSGDGSQQQSSDDLCNMIHITGQNLNCSFEVGDDPEVMLQQISESIREKETSNGDNGHRGNDLLTEDAAGGNDGPPDCLSYGGGNQYVSHFFEAKQHKFSDYGNEGTCWGLVEDICYLRPADNERTRSFDNHHLNIPAASGNLLIDSQEKGMLTVDVYASSQQSEISGHGGHPVSYKLNGSLENIFHNDASISVKKVGDNSSDIAVRFSCDGVDQENQQDTGEGGSKSYTSMLEAEPGVLDVHVIDNRILKEEDKNEYDFSELPSASVSSRSGDLIFEPNESKKVDISRSYSSGSWMEAEKNIHRSISDLRGVLLPVDTSCENLSLSELRRNSMSSVDKERLKLENEVELLRERLKIIQEGRKNLNFSVEHKKESFRLKLLEEIASQLHEIRQLTKQKQTVCQVSLPSSSSKEYRD